MVAMISFKKINQEVVKPIKLPVIKHEDIKGCNLFPEIYANIFLCAKKKSGKTSTIYKIIKSCINKNTKIIVFCSTCNKDKNWMAIKKWLISKKIHNEFYTSIHDNEALLTLINELQALEFENEINSSDSEEEKEDQIIKFDKKIQSYKVYIRKPKKIAPEYVIIFDDLSLELKDKNIAHLLKTNRHYKSKVIISSQYINDLLPEARKQMDYVLLFGGHNVAKLEEIYNWSDLNISFEEFVNIYKKATKEKYNFLYIDTNNSEFRRNFSDLIILSS